MSVTSLLIHLIGAVALLLWSAGMVKKGVTRAYGTSLRLSIARSTKNRFSACLSGAAVTTVLQSSVATTLILVSFLKSGFIAVPVALAAVIGADIATTLVAQLLTFDLSWLSPVLLTGGIVIYNVFQGAGRERHIGRAIIGIGLMLLALTMIRQTSAPLQHSDVLPLILQPLNNEPLLAIVFAAILTYLLHSSLAAILIFSAFAAHSIISLDLGLHLVLGANLGGALIPLVATMSDGLKVRRLTVGNLTMRLLTVLIMVPLLPLVQGMLLDSGTAPARYLVHFHTGFNVLLGVLFLPFVGVLSNFMERLFPDRNEKTDQWGPQYLDERSLGTPVIALAGAARETLRMAEIVEKMLQQTITAFEKNDDRLIRSVREMDNQVDHLNQAIKLYLTRLSHESFDPKEADRYIQILTFSTNLEYCGDIIDKSLLDAAEKKMRSHESFSEKGFAEIKDFHNKIVENLKLAQIIFLSEDHELASQLVENKKMVREAESETSRMHFKRLHERQAQSIATSGMHLDIVRDLRRINSYITSIAFTILDNHEKYKKKRVKKKSVAPAADAVTGPVTEPPGESPVSSAATPNLPPTDKLH
jgi:phosphate:Na+ symporter